MKINAQASSAGRLFRADAPVGSRRHARASRPAEVVPASMYFSPEDAQLTAQLQVEIQNYVEQNTVAFITGQRGIDTEWDSYVQGLRRPAPGPLPRGNAEDLRRLPVVVFLAG